MCTCDLDSLLVHIEKDSRDFQCLYIEKNLPVTKNVYHCIEKVYCHSMHILVNIVHKLIRTGPNENERDNGVGGRGLGGTKNVLYRYFYLCVDVENWNLGPALNYYEFGKWRKFPYTLHESSLMYGECKVSCNERIMDLYCH